MIPLRSFLPVFALLSVALPARADDDAAPIRRTRQISPVVAGSAAQAGPAPSGLSGYAIRVSEFSASREVMNGALASKVPFDALNEAVKAGRATVKSHTGSNVFGYSRHAMISTQVPLVSGSTVQEGRTSSSITYRDVGCDVTYTLQRGENDAGALITFSLSDKIFSEGIKIDGGDTPALSVYRCEGTLLLSKGVPALFSSDDTDSLKPQDSRAVFVRADW